MNLQGWTDSDWGSDTDSRNSVTGFYFQLGGGVVSWQSKKQPTMALSSTKVEFMAGASCAKEAIWLWRLIQDLVLSV